MFTHIPWSRSVHSPADAMPQYFIGTALLCHYADMLAVLGNAWSGITHKGCPTSPVMHLPIPCSSGLEQNLSRGRETLSQSNQIVLHNQSFSVNLQFIPFPPISIRAPRHAETESAQSFHVISFIYRQGYTSNITVELQERHWSCTFTLNCTFQTLL